MAATKRSRCLKKEEKFSHQIKLKESLTVKCVCPKCGTNHRMKMLWTGRGRPKKFCPPCKIFVSSVEQADFCTVPTILNTGIE
jgi:uncharacterized protein (DUF983 family)